MYKVDDMIIYGDMGACRIIDITTPDFVVMRKDELYYVLKSYYQNCVIYTPVNTTVYMRSIHSAVEVERLIDRIPAIQAEMKQDGSAQQILESPEVAINTHDCTELLKYAMAVYAKKEAADQQKHRLAMVDEKCMKQAEELLASEFALALGIPKDEVKSYIETRVNGLKDSLGKENDE